MLPISATVLIIEDDVFLHELCKKKFVKEGFHVLSAFTGQQGLKKLEKEKPEVILLDLLLPETDGMVILQQLRQREDTKNIPVIIMSNYSDRERVQQGLALGAVDYIIKAHFTPDEIIGKVTKVLQNKKN